MVGKYSNNPLLPSAAEISPDGVNKGAADGGSSDNIKQTTMASNEEILQEFGCPEVPFNENVTMYYPAILSSMDAARKDEVEAWEKWRISHKVFWSGEEYFYENRILSFIEIYTIFKNQNS